MKAADPTIKIGAVADTGEDSDVNYTDHPATNPRTGVAHNGWTPGAASHYEKPGRHAGFPHLPQIWGLQRRRRAASVGLDVAPRTRRISASSSPTTWAPPAPPWSWSATENNGPITSGVDVQSTSLVTGLYFADSMGQILQTEFNARIWWDLRNGQTPTSLDPTLYGWRPYSDDGMVYGDGSPPTRYPQYYCGKILKYFAAGGDLILSSTSDYQLLSAYAAKRADGSVSVMVINKTPNTAPQR